MWDPQYESDVERIFHRLASSRLSDMLYDERKNIAEDRSYRPHWMAEDHWRALLSYWATNDIYKKRSTANKRNRASSRQARHTQGSVTTATHARHMAKDLGRDPYIDELHRENHIIHGTDVYVDDRSYNTQVNLYFDTICNTLNSALFITICKHGKFLLHYLLLFCTI